MLFGEKFFMRRVTQKKLVRKRRARASCDRKGKKKSDVKKAYIFLKGLHDETGCGGPKDRRRKSEKQISIMRTSFSTIKAKTGGGNGGGDGS